MFTKADILARLQNGETADTIAEEMATALNEAETQYQEEVIKANAEKIEADRIHAAKSAAVDGLVDALCDYCVAAEAHDLLEELYEVDNDKVIEILDGTIKFAKSLNAMKNLEFQEAEKKDDIVGYFFDLLG